MKAVFVELPAFERYRAEYFSDEAFTTLQAILMKSPHAGDVIEGTGGLRKLRFADARRGKGKRGVSFPAVIGHQQQRGIIELMEVFE